MSGFRSYMHSPTLEAMLTFQGWSHGFTAADRDAMAEALTVIRNAVVQPVGLSRATEPRHVTEAEFDRAVMQVLCGVLALTPPGRPQAMEVDA